MKAPKLVLASSSPRRSELLRQIGLEFEVIPSSVAEEWDAGERPEEIARKLAKDKAEDVARRLSSGIVIGADTLVVLDGKIMGKPRDGKEAFNMLRTLSAKRHEVITALALIDAANRKTLASEQTTSVYFRNLSDQEIHAYIATGEPMDKAGAYGIQGKGVLLVERIEGCYTNVVGLPLVKLLDLLSRIGCTAPSQPSS